MSDSTPGRAAQVNAYSMEIPSPEGSPVPASQAQAQEPALPLASIVIPCHNSQAYLAEAIESALRQSYPALEIIVVDNGSTDRSPVIAQQFPVRYLRLERPGLTPARNAGIDASRGRYVAFLDSDDRLRPDAIACGVRLLEQRPECAMAIGDHIFIDGAGEWIGDSRKRSLTEEADGNIYELLLKSNFIEMISSVLFRREVFSRVGGFDPTLRAAEDYDLYLRVAKACEGVCHSSVIAEYRMHDSNSSRNAELMLLSSLNVLERQAPYLGDRRSRVAAFQYGVREWKRQYGRRLAADLGGGFGERQGAELARKLRLLAHYYPPGLALALLRKLLPAGAYGRLREKASRLHALLPADRSLAGCASVVSPRAVERPNRLV